MTVSKENSPVLDCIINIWMESLSMAQSGQQQGIRSMISTAEYLAVFLANCCQTREDESNPMQDALLERSLRDKVFYEMLISMILGPSPLTVDAGLDLMAALTRDNYEACEYLAKTVKGTSKNCSNQY